MSENKKLASLIMKQTNDDNEISGFSQINLNKLSQIYKMVDKEIEKIKILQRLQQNQKLML